MSLPLTPAVNELSSSNKGSEQRAHRPMYTEKMKRMVRWLIFFRAEEERSFDFHAITLFVLFVSLYAMITREIPICSLNSLPSCYRRQCFVCIAQHRGNINTLVRLLNKWPALVKKSVTRTPPIHTLINTWLSKTIYIAAIWLSGWWNTSALISG